jgi:hypothetical protein
MTGLVGMTDRAAASKNRGGVWAILLALLLGGAMALSPPPPAPADGRAMVASAESPWGGATLPEPQAQNRNSLASATVPSQRWRPTSSPWPEPESKDLATAVSPRLNAGRGLVHRPTPAAVRKPRVRWLAYDPHGPPFFTR